MGLSSSKPPGYDVKGYNTVAEWDALTRERDELRAEVEKTERKMQAHRETAVAAIAGTEKLLHAAEDEVERLREHLEIARAAEVIQRDKAMESYDEARRLRAALTTIAYEGCCSGCMETTARTALD